MTDPITTFLARLCTLFVGLLVVVFVFQLYTQDTYGASSDFGMVSMSDNPNLVAVGMAKFASESEIALNSAGKVLERDARSVETVAVGSVRLTGRAMWYVTASAGHIAWGSATFVGRSVGGGVMFVGKGVVGSVVFAGHTVGSALGIASSVTHVGSVIRPTANTPLPVIKLLRAQQAAIIQHGTKDVAVASASVGAGGACDNGNGNGGYPMAWCNAPMDSVATVSYSSDRINRECTSYAYWYFTRVEGHTDFRVWRDAKYWAATSNYPVHAAPKVGAIAVETVGAYGHVAIVRALSGQKYAGEVVPAGYMLVSEMNYDWNGHFRYSYSPLGKFSAYIYR